MDTLPLTPAQQQQQQRMMAFLAREIGAAGGAIPFHRYMELALYAPGLGYYVAGASKFGESGDFVTAPQISPLFSQCLANQCAEILEVTGGSILEFGAGTGVMASDILRRLEQLDRLPESYFILEPSPDLRQRQLELLEQKVPELTERLVWLERLPERFQGVVLANEVLDAMPVHRFRKGRENPQEQWVTLEDGRLAGSWRPASQELAEALSAIEETCGGLAEGYVSEVNLNLGPWFKSLGTMLERGVALLIDYGHERSAYYHPQRHMGTLMCHFRHRAHDDPFLLPGLQDITAHVDFTAVAEAARAARLELLGYRDQAGFLLGCGIDRLMAGSDPDRMERHMKLVQGARQLLMPGGMGEKFKVMAVGKGVDETLMGFSG